MTGTTVVVVVVGTIVTETGTDIIIGTVTGVVTEIMIGQEDNPNCHSKIDFGKKALEIEDWKTCSKMQNVFLFLLDFKLSLLFLYKHKFKNAIISELFSCNIYNIA